MLSNHRKPVLLALKSSRTSIRLVELLRQLLKIRLRRILKLLRLLRQRLKLLQLRVIRLRFGPVLRSLLSELLDVIGIERDGLTARISARLVGSRGVLRVTHWYPPGILVLPPPGRRVRTGGRPCVG